MTACHQIKRESMKSRSCLSSPVWIPSDADSLVSGFMQPVPCRIINSQAGRRLTRISAPGSPIVGHPHWVTHTGSQMSCLCWRKRTLTWGRVSRWCKGLLPCTNLPLLYWPGWKDIGTLGKNTLLVLIKQVKLYILIFIAMSYVHLNQPYHSISVFEGFKVKPNSWHDCTS